jgi:hypothetical protein
MQKVSGTLAIASSPATAALLRGRLARRGTRPLYVSAATGKVNLFIDGAATPSGTLTACPAATGSVTGCTIAWTTTVAVPAAHTFTVEIDTGTANSPNNTVLAEGEGSYALVAGTANILSALSLNAVVTNATFTIGTCTATSCSGTVVLADAAGFAIAYTGTATTPPTYGQSPTSGNVYDNSGVAGASNVTLTSNAPAVGTVTGTAQAPFSTYTAPTLTLAGVDTTGSYTYAVTCVAAATGTFGITVGGGATPSGDVTTGELTGVGVTYPAAGVVTNPTAPSFTCTNGNIGSATGTLPVN